MKKYISEFIGTFILVLIGCGVAVISGANLVATSLAFGLTLLALIYTIGNVSGAHLNPAVSFAKLLTNDISFKDFLFYAISQILGSICASSILGVLLGDFTNLGTNGFGEGFIASSAGIALLVEIIITFIFITVILRTASTSENKNINNIVIALTLVLVNIFGIYFTGCSVNPARSLGPAIIQGGIALSQVWVFIFAPLIGATLACIFNEYLNN